MSSEGLTASFIQLIKNASEANLAVLKKKKIEKT